MNRMQSRVRRFTRGMRRALKRLDRVTSKIARGLATGIKRGAMVAAAAVTTVGFAVKRLADDFDELAKFSRTVQFPIEELQEWQFVAEQSGVKNESFRKSIGKFTKTIGEARKGFGTMAENLKRMDPQLLKQLKNTDNVSDAMEMYLGAIRKTPDAMDKAALATTAFGRSGMDMIVMANLAQDEIAALRKEQRENGIVTMEQAKAAEEFNDSLNSLILSGKGFLQGVLMPVMPLLSQGFRRMREWVVANKDWIGSRVLEFGEDVVANWKDIVKWIKRIAGGIAGFFALAGAVKVLIGVVELLNIVMAANPIGLIVAGVAALGAMLAAAFIWGEELFDLFSKLPLPLKALAAVILAFSGPFAAILAAVVLLKVHFEKVKAVASVVFGAIADFAVAAVDVIEAAWAPIESFFISLWNKVVGVFESAINFMINTGPISWLIAAVFAIKRNWEFLAIVFEALWVTITTLFSQAVNWIVSSGPVQWLIGAVQTIQDAWNTLPFIMGAIWEIISNTISDAVNWIVNEGPISWLIGAVDATESAWSPVVDFFKGIWESIVGVFQTAIDKIADVVDPLRKFFKTVSDAKKKILGEEVGDIDLSGLKIPDTERDVSNVVNVDFKRKVRLPEILAPEVRMPGKRGAGRAPQMGAREMFESKVPQGEQAENMDRLFTEFMKFVKSKETEEEQAETAAAARIPLFNRQ
ncbi:MAG: phage tail protein, partial [Planctomycetota bacterium]